MSIMVSIIIIVIIRDHVQHIYTQSTNQNVRCLSIELYAILFLFGQFE
jgi:hypothetical protein